MVTHRGSLHPSFMSPHLHVHVALFAQDFAIRLHPPPPLTYPWNPLPHRRTFCNRLPSHTAALRSLIGLARPQGSFRHLRQPADGAAGTCYSAQFCGTLLHPATPLDLSVQPYLV